MTIVCLPMRMNAAQLVSPSGGVMRTPAAVTVRSLRGTETLNTPSLSLSLPLAPVSSSIRAVSSLAPAGGDGCCACAAAQTIQRVKIARASFMCHTSCRYVRTGQMPCRPQARQRHYARASLITLGKGEGLGAFAPGCADRGGRRVCGRAGVRYVAIAARDLSADHALRGRLMLALALACVLAGAGVGMASVSVTRRAI